MIIVILNSVQPTQCYKVRIFNNHALSQTTLSQPATPLKQHAGFGILPLLILSLLFVLFINTAYAGRYYGAGYFSSQFGATPEEACRALTKASTNIHAQFRYLNSNLHKCHYEHNFYGFWKHQQTLVYAINGTCPPT